MAKGGNAMSIKKLKKDVRGAALVYVIVAAAIIILLGAATTATAYVNLRATQLQEKSDNNFYSADAIMNAIISGLEGDISRSCTVAYAQSLESLHKSSSESELIAIEEKFKSDFKTAFKELMAYKEDGDDKAENPFNKFYSIEKLQEYAQEVYGNNPRYTVTALNGNSYMDETSEGFILRNLHVTYENDSGYYDEILTDVRISVPQFDPELIDVSNLKISGGFVVDDGLEVLLGKGLQINGDAYINEHDETHNAILLQNESSLAIISPTELIAGGLIETINGASLTLKGTSELKDSNLVWVHDFNLGRNTTTELIGQIFVYDDLEINGSYAEVKLAGEYYGYSRSSTLADESSSININGGHTTLDISELDMLVLAGSSYLSTTTIDPAPGYEASNTDMQLGEALSVKSNQIAYFVDPTEFSESDIIGFKTNPMTVKEYNDMCAKNVNESQVFNTMLNKQLTYGKSYAQFGATIKKVYSARDNNTEGGTVYLYLEFADVDKASDFFVTVYKGNTLLSQRLRTYAAEYIKNLKFNKDTELLVNQNYINSLIDLYSSYTENNLPTILPGLGYDKNQPNQTTMNELLDNIKTTYLDDGTPTGNGEKYKVMYSKLINQSMLADFVKNATTQELIAEDNTNNNIEIVDDGVVLKGTNGSIAVIVDNKESGVPYELGSGSGIAIISGDAYITGDWLGTIIIGGRAYVTEGLKNAPLNITVDTMVINSVTPLYYTYKEGDVEKSISILNLFVGCENVKVNNATSDHGINADMISNCITFTNWENY